MILTCDTYALYDPTAIERSVESDELYQPEPAVKIFHDLWAELHSKQSPTPEWFESWLSRVPKFGCNCQDDFRKYVADNPPDFGAGWYAWTVSAHNFVNAKLNKPIWSIDLQPPTA